eukprot:TRINITY_DN17198_c0_g1_i1.p1 TRINITY_DN17198_c0_g1~~TRINITY_DN17198_c0_g1_i1.p1  ORF type:complete len:265 (+),score=74.08 TRINITY_DN17198_c0_g1_i1:65-796(+)
MQSSLIALALLCLALVGVHGVTYTPPLWGGTPAFTVPVNETTYNGASVQWGFRYYYDASQRFQQRTVERYEHAPPQWDMMCQDLGVDNSQKYQCNVVFATDGWSYVAFPEVDFCCKCGNGFGAIAYDWLQEDSYFNGNEELAGLQVQHWAKLGNTLNNYYATNDDLARPVRVYDYAAPDPATLNQWDFDVKQFVAGNPNPALFAPPAGCTTLCKGNWACTMFRNDSAAQLGHHVSLYNLRHHA